MLICQNDPPHFAGDDSGGDEVALFFGETNFDDIWLTETLYIIKLRRHGSEWLLEVESFSVWGAWNQKRNVDALVAELNTAIQTRTDFDFAGYLDDWKRQDEHFDFRIFRNMIFHDLYPDGGYNVPFWQAAAVNEDGCMGNVRPECYACGYSEC
jgi:hypothetical protein